MLLNKFFCVCLAAGLMAGSNVFAGDAQRDRLQATIDAALDVIYSDCCSDLSNQQKQAKIRETVEANYDLDVIIRRAIGRNWRVMDEGEQTEVLELIKQLVLKAYMQSLEGKGRPEVKLGALSKTSDKRMEIKSTITLDGQTYHVLYRLGRMRSGWQIYDIVAENISIVANYREQIDDHFRKGSGAELIARLKELLKKETIDEDIQI